MPGQDKPARILEKQNRLQMSQSFFLYPHTNYSAVLLFKDSTGGTAETQRYRIPTPLLNVRTNQKPKRSMLITRPQFPGTSNKSSVPQERGRFTQSTLLPTRP